MLFVWKDSSEFLYISQGTDRSKPGTVFKFSLNTAISTNLGKGGSQGNLAIF